MTNANLNTAIGEAEERKTYDNLDVPENYTLDFSVCCQAIGWDGTILQIEVKWQRHGKRKRPFLSVVAGPILFQAGWLWG